MDTCIHFHKSVTTTIPFILLVNVKCIRNNFDNIINNQQEIIRIKIINPKAVSFSSYYSLKEVKGAIKKECMS